MGVSKVTLNGDTLMDITSDTVDQSNLITGFTAHGADGESVAGAYTPVTYDVATETEDGLMSSGDKKKLNEIAAGAEVNQNAFSNVKVGSTTIAADSKTDTLTLTAGDNITLTPNATSDSVTIAVNGTVTGVKGNSETSYRTGDVNITKANIGLGNVENKTSATIRGELTKSNVTTALGYTPYTQAEVDALVSSVFNYKGSKTTYTQVSALTDMKTGDVWQVTEDNSEYVYNGSAWEKLGPTIDLSGYLTSVSVAGQSLTPGANSITAAQLKTALGLGSAAYAATATTVGNNSNLPTGAAVQSYVTGLGYTTNTGTVTKVSTGAGLTGGDVTTTGTIKADLKSETKSSLTAASKGSTASREYAVGLDANGDLSVNVPWENTQTITGVKGSSESTYRTGNVSISASNIGLGNVENKSSATIRGELTSQNVIDALGYTPGSSSGTVTKVTAGAGLSGGDITTEGTISLKGQNVYYATCTTAAGTAAKVAATTNGDFELTTGAMVRVKFTNADTYNGTSTLNVDSKGAKNIIKVGTTVKPRYYWQAGEVVDFVYDGTYFVMLEAATATTTYYGITALSSATNSTSEVLAATPKAVKEAYDLAASKTDNTGTVTSVATGAGLTGGTITGSGTIKADLKSETKSSLTAASKGSTANREYAVGLDANGDLSVNIPWENTQTITGVKGSSESTYRTGNVSISATNIGLGNVENKSSATIRGELTKSNVTTALGFTPYTQDEVNALVSSVFTYKGTKSTYAQVSALTGMKIGDVWQVTEDNSEYVYNGTAWEKLGPTIDLSGYLTSVSVAGHSLTPGSNSITADQLKTALGLGSAAYVDTESTVANDAKLPTGAAVKSFVEGKGYTTNTGTITEIKMNGSSKGTSGSVDLGTVLTAHQTIKQDGVTGATVNRFGTCGIAAGTAAKTVAITTGTFSLETGAKVTVKFTYANTASNPTLNVGGTGAKNIFHRGSRITTGANKALLAGTCEFVYDGTQYHLIGNYYDTTYSSLDAASGGTSVSLVTTGEKYTWNQKTSNTGTVTSVATGTGLTGGPITTTGTISLEGGVVTAGSAGPTAAVTGNEGNTVAIPRITVDEYGRVTGLTSYNLTNKNTTYTAATTAPGNVASSSAVGTSTNYARQDHTHGITLATGDSNGQVKIAGSNVSVKGWNTAATYDVESTLANDSKLPTGAAVTAALENVTVDFGTVGSANNAVYFDDGTPTPVDHSIGHDTDGNVIVAWDGGEAITPPAGTALPITQGGTGATTAAAARTNLGLGSAATYNVVSSVNNDNNLVTGAAIKNYYEAVGIPSAICTTSAGTASKVATCSSFSLLANSYIQVIMANANSASTALTLNINGTGDKPIYINGSASYSGNKTLPAGSYFVFYDGTNYYFRTDGKITADITGNAATVNGHTVAKDVPSNAVFTDTTALTSMTGILGVEHGGTGKSESLIVTQDFGYNTTFSYDAGTIGTRGKQETYTISMDGYYPISAMIIYIANSSAYANQVFFTDNVLYVNYYRASTAAQTSVKSTRVRVAYLKS